MRRALPAVALALVGLGTIAPAGSLADGPSRGQVLVPGDHHLPGESMQITGYDLEPGDQLTFTLERNGSGVILIAATVAGDGTVSTTAAVPTDFPTGYAEVVGSNAGGTLWRTVVLIGERAEGPKPSDADGPVSDLSTLGIVMVGLGLVIVVAALAWYVGGRRKRSSTAD
jgi:hypothetical protein